MSHFVEIADDTNCSGAAYLSDKPIANVFFVLLLPVNAFDNPKSANLAYLCDESFKSTFYNFRSQCTKFILCKSCTPFRISNIMLCFHLKDIGLSIDDLNRYCFKSIDIFSITRMIDILGSSRDTSIPCRSTK